MHGHGLEVLFLEGHSYQMANVIGGSMRLILIISLLMSSGLTFADGEDEEFVRHNCEALGHGIHQKVENYTTEDGFSDIVMYSLFCGVELRAGEGRTLRGHYTQEVGYELSLDWGYLKYTPTSMSIQRRAVEEGVWEIGEWESRSRELHNIVVLAPGPEIINGSWSWCHANDFHYCDDK